MGKKVSVYLDIILIVSMSLLFAIAVVFDDWRVMIYPRAALGIPLVLFFPGYVFSAALYPLKNDLELIPRLFLSLGLSITAVPLVGLALCYTPWGLRLIPILISLTVFILAISLVAAFRRSSLARDELFVEPFWLEWTAWISQLRGRPLVILLLLTMMGSAGVGLYTLMPSQTNYERFTEFYILGVNGKAEGYPQRLRVNEEGVVLIGINNLEHSTEEYFIEVLMGGAMISKKGPISLNHGQGLEELVSFSYPVPQEKIKVEFLLLKEGETEPYHSLYLWLTVLPKSS